jgi:hypothetical protein
MICCAAQIRSVCALTWLSLASVLVAGDNVVARMRRK